MLFVFSVGAVCHTTDLVPPAMYPHYPQHQQTPNILHVNGTTREAMWYHDQRQRYSWLLTVAPYPRHFR